MTINNFVWTDLSTFDMDKARSDYAALFGWSFSNDATYDFAASGETAMAAVFPMPEFLVKINMPSFWMSYIHVADLDAAVETARGFAKAKIEIEPQPFDTNARIALVRDPSGAGFTLYEGPDITPNPDAAGHVVERYHHVPDINLIAPFYKAMFGWSFTKTSDGPWPSYEITNETGTRVAIAEEVPEGIRGKFRYWMPCFAVSSAAKARQTLETIGGQVTTDLPDGRVMAADQQGGNFMIVERGSTQPTDTPNETTNTLPWRALIGFACIWAAVLFDIQAFWGVLFLIWTWPSIKNKRIDFIDSIHRADHPVLYWAFVGTWAFLSLWLIAQDVLPTGG